MTLGRIVTRDRLRGTSSSTTCPLVARCRSCKSEALCQSICRFILIEPGNICLQYPPRSPRLFPTFDFVWNITGIILAATSKTCSENMPDVYHSILAFASAGLRQQTSAACSVCMTVLQFIFQYIYIYICCFNYFFKTIFFASLEVTVGQKVLTL